MNKIKVGVLGATGAVGQRFVQMLQGHPWFEITALFASERSAGKRYVEACRWNLRGDMPESVREMPVLACEPGPDCQIVFSALPSETAGEIEEEFAAAGYVVCSNARNHRYDEDVPLLIPEVNPEHLKLIEVQKRKRGWSGCIVTNPNCSTTHMISALHPLHVRFGVKKVFVVTMQAVSGAGYPGVSSMDILDNVIPFISGEEEKMELKEPQKLLGIFDGERIRYADIVISAHCNRVPTRNGHLEAISVEFEERPKQEAIIDAWRAYNPLPQQLRLPSAPRPAIIYDERPDRPQPRLDRLAGSVPGMATVVGRLRPDPLLHYKFMALGHNTIRGAAGGSLLNAELLVAQGYLGQASAVLAESAVMA
ncbi:MULTISPECIES: aspartate-semialdehyde dehydrogenase [Caldilinea]|jgi:aspartate-semialdehyde dehydrogenase|uniref:Aspartate-semialdehyde dehydrogenase n=1 Tax=Caldilinea aerophila (strain DSM 14535 / JCM 11387 / NBRC 104270 / STL-6-O1) TaxID=926550 RepID=I0I148_CALAS|nr:MULTISPECIES: aspartate-semialdehyde dehydrogenase [Caldilinea]MBO9394324.1 aspartate-semialdehyde dehydrogenase [Caldilinea sp.]BAL98985.1 aspartate-semialdehyde dehydrogenase [Caldilinea aerophila DSM 14535 = NBRC 104270]GIV74427.1 MAG: aspartate-semialdehyde dehydrogenase [Caldilinea sp.]